MNQKLDKNLKYLGISDKSILDILVKSGVKIDKIYSIEDFETFNFICCLLENSKEPVFVKVNKNQILFTNDILYLKFTEKDFIIPLTTLK